MPSRRTSALVACSALALSATAIVGSGGPAGASPDDGGTVTFDLAGYEPGDPNNWNPYGPAAHKTNGMSQALFEPLFVTNLITGENEPWLAESLASNDTFDSWTLSLRDGIDWHDGEPFGADDVVFTVGMLQQFPELNTPLKFEGVTAEATDDLTVTFTLDAPNARFGLEYFSTELQSRSFFVVPEHIWSAVDDPVAFTYTGEDGWPVTTSAYSVASATDGVFTYSRNDSWWGVETGFDDMPAPSTLVWTALGTEETRLGAFSQGDLDELSEISIGSFQALAGRAESAITWSTAPPYGIVDLCPRSLEFNASSGPGADPALRQAIARTIDRSKIIEVAYQGGTTPSYFNLPAFPGLQSFIDIADGIAEERGLTAPDPDAATTLLEDAGYVKDGDRWTKDGAPVTLRIANYDDPQLNAMAGVIVEELQQAGIDATQEQMTVPNFVDALMAGEFEAYVFFGACGSTTDPVASLDAFHVRWEVPAEEPITGFYHNSWRWYDEAAQEYSAIIDEMRTLPVGDPGLEPLFTDAAAILADAQVSIPLIQNPLINVVSDVRWTGWPSEDGPYIQAYYTAQTTISIIHAIQPA